MERKGHTLKRKECGNHGNGPSGEETVQKRARYTSEVGNNSRDISDDEDQNEADMGGENHEENALISESKESLTDSQKNSCTALNGSAAAGSSVETSNGNHHGNQVMFYADISLNLSRNPRHSIENDIFDLPMPHVPESSSQQTNSQVSDLQNYNLHKWQSKHIAKSIVDNAINMTLEEMGVAPESEADTFKREKTEIESFGISHAIESQGLTRQCNMGAMISSTVSPIISNLRDAANSILHSPAVQDYGETRETCRLNTENEDNDEHASLRYSDNLVEHNCEQSNVLDQAVSMAISSQGLVMKSS